MRLQIHMKIGTKLVHRPTGKKFEYIALLARPAHPLDGSYFLSSLVVNEFGANRIILVSETELDIDYAEITANNEEILDLLYE